MHLLHQDACLLVLALVTMPYENYNDACLHQFVSIFFSYLYLTHIKLSSLNKFPDVHCNVSLIYYIQ